MERSPLKEERSLAQSKLYLFDKILEEQQGTIIGTDEVGRGPLAGPVVSAAVILDLEKPIDGLDDSKKLTEKKREDLYPKILDQALSVSIALCNNREIDRLNILQASLFSMYKAISKTELKWDFVAVDGNKYIPQIDQSIQQTVVKGDGKSASIAAASIVAKVVRDRIMVAFHKKWPQYNWKKNKGYPTQEHREALLSAGLTPIHRISFCESFASQTELLF